MNITLILVGIFIMWYALKFHKVGSTGKSNLSAIFLIGFICILLGFL